MTISQHANIVGTGGDDSLIGSAGNDTFEGKHGIDTIVGGDGFDTAIFNLGAPGAVGLFDLGSGSLGVSVGGSTIFQIDAHSTIGGLTLMAFDLRAGGLGIDVMEGVERVVVNSTTSSVTLDFQQTQTFAPGVGRTITGTVRSEVIDVGQVLVHATAADRVDVFGGFGHDSIYGHNGKNLLNGGDGSDSMQGWGGDDTFVGGEGGDFLHGGEGTDVARYVLENVGGNFTRVNKTDGTFDIFWEEQKVFNVAKESTGNFFKVTDFRSNSSGIDILQEVERLEFVTTGSSEPNSLPPSVLYVDLFPVLSHGTISLGTLANPKSALASYSGEDAAGNFVNATEVVRSFSNSRDLSPNSIGADSNGVDLVDIAAFGRTTNGVVQTGAVQLVGNSNRFGIRSGDKAVDEAGFTPGEVTAATGVGRTVVGNGESSGSYINDGEMLRIALKDDAMLAETATITFGTNRQTLGGGFDTTDVDVILTFWRDGEIVGTREIDLTTSGRTFAVDSPDAVGFDAIDIQAADANAFLTLAGVRLSVFGEYVI